MMGTADAGCSARQSPHELQSDLQSSLAKTERKTQPLICLCQFQEDPAQGEKCPHKNTTTLQTTSCKCDTKWLQISRVLMIYKKEGKKGLLMIRISSTDLMQLRSLLPRN